MDSGHDNTEEEEADRLSNLPDDLIHKILSFISIEDTVKTMALSSRYRFIWTTMPYINFSTWSFPRLENFIDYFLKGRNNQIDMSSLELDFWEREFTEPSVNKLMHYAFSHNVQRFEVTFSHDGWLIELPLLVFSSQSLKHLSLTTLRESKLKATSILELPTLTTLYLEGVTFYRDDDDNSCVVGLFSKCTNLKNLTLQSCKIDRLLSICPPGLSDLTLDDVRGLRFVDVVNVVAPQLENLTIRYDKFSIKELVISAPNLASLAYKGRNPLPLSTDGFHSLKEADIRVLDDLEVDDAHQMVCLLQQLHNVKFLTLNLEIIELLSRSVELISHQPSLFVNLKSLTIYPVKLLKLYPETFQKKTIYLDVLCDSEWRSLPKGKVNLSTEVKNYLLDSSPGASVTMFSREEIIAARDFASAQESMAKLRELLEQEKADIKANRANTNRGKAPIEGDNAKMQLQIGGSNTLIWSCWKDLSKQFERREAKVCRIINMLESIEGLLREQPATKRDMIQACFSNICAEADTIMRKITKMQCAEQQSRISVCFHELATSTTMETSS